MDQEPQVIEPLAKFHSPVYKNGRIAIPSNERDYFGLDKHDIVLLVVRNPNGRGLFWAQLTVHGRLTIPQGLRQHLSISEGDFVEVLLVDFIKIKNVVGEEGYRILRAVRTNSYRLLDHSEEIEILKHPKSKISFSTDK